jgi:hypothetical protein
LFVVCQGDEPSLKRPRTEPGPASISWRQLKDAVLTRSEIARWLDLHVFAKLCAGCYIIRSVPSTGGKLVPNLVEVKGVAPDSQTEYSVAGDGVAVATRRKLQVLDLASGRAEAMRLDVISNKKLSDVEGDALIAACRGARFPTPVAVARQLDERERIVGDATRGLAASVVVRGVEEEWGAAAHSAAVLLRSWLIEATPVLGASDGVGSSSAGGGGGGGGGATGASAGAGADGAREEKYRGEYHFLLLVCEDVRRCGVAHF